MSVTTDAEMLAVERWAKARGFWNEHNGADVVLIHPWSVRIVDGFAEIYTTKHARPGRTIDGWQRIDPHTALLWACTVETTETLTSPPMRSEAEARAWAAARVMSGRMEILRPSGVSARRPGEPREFVARVTRPLAVDVGKCQACVARSLPGRKLATTEWGIATAYGRTKPYIAHARYHPAAGWLRGWSGKRRKGSSQWAQHHVRPCPDCNGTGRDLREVARLVLDAAPVWESGEDHGRHGQEPPRCDGPGDPQARDRLSVAADQLQAAGERLGTWHALGLAGRDDAAAEMAAWLGERTTQGMPVTTPRPVAVRWSGLHPDEFPGSDFP